MENFKKLTDYTDETPVTAGTGSTPLSQSVEEAAQNYLLSMEMSDIEVVNIRNAFIAGASHLSGNGKAEHQARQQPTDGKSFLDVLNENYQAVCGHDAYEILAEHSPVSAVRETYEDLIGIYKANFEAKGQQPVKNPMLEKLRAEISTSDKQEIDEYIKSVDGEQPVRKTLDELRGTVYEVPDEMKRALTEKKIDNLLGKAVSGEFDDYQKDIIDPILKLSVDTICPKCGTDTDTLARFKSTKAVEPQDETRLRDVFLELLNCATSDIQSDLLKTDTKLYWLREAGLVEPPTQTHN